MIVGINLDNGGVLMSEQVMMSELVDEFDRTLESLRDLPDVVRTKPTTMRHQTFYGASQVFIIQTVRQRERGDTIFLEYVDRNGTKRIPIPPNVADVIARQRDALGTMSRKRAGRALAQERQDNGWESPLLRPEVREKAQAARKAARRKKAKKREA
jgi:hypothetical protein